MVINKNKLVKKNPVLNLNMCNKNCENPFSFHHLQLLEHPVVQELVLHLQNRPEI